MEQIKTIILNKKEYKITEVAYLLIQDYLNYIEKTEKNKDTLLEIEIQISIILDMELEAKEKYKVVEKPDIEEVISVLKENRKIKYTAPRRLQYKKKKNSTHKITKQETSNGFKRSRNNILGGVCAGIGEWLNIDPIIVRILFIIAAFFKGFIIPIYIILWIIIPSDNKIVRV
ncbi:MAG: PspC domain-containing protein [Chlorobi bacterium]|nr:PspC domain-containing protein [Chlorobiota bacterium]